MLTQQRTTKAGTIDRTINITEEREPWGTSLYATVLEVTHLKTKDRSECDVYILEPVRCDIGGKAVLVRKHKGETHHVHIDRTIGDSCTCPGGTYTGKCRHLEMVRLAIGLKLV
jgi:hypothetical protein